MFFKIFEFNLKFVTEPALPAEIRCSHHDNLLYAIPNSGCSSYYRCYQRTVFRHRCNEKSVFDFYQQKCVRSEGWSML